MGIIRGPGQIVYTTITLQRWEKDWVKLHDSINFSGLVQEMIIELIRKHDPVYYEQNVQFLQESKRRDFSQSLIRNHPGIIPLNSPT
ncbi:MAG: hypothetical protein LV468_01300 [Candidatus Nitrosotenuis sp.]|nr:hypothetical protein [Candidatus Nitrosotenuis sp.]